MFETMDSKLLSIVLLALFRQAACEQCAAPSSSNMKFVVQTQRNQTGHWITKVRVDNDASSGAAAAADMQTGRWTLSVDQSTESCVGSSDSISLQATITAPPPLAGPGYELFSGVGRYRLYPVGKTWAESRSACARDNAHLAIINSVRESEVLRDLLAQYPANTLKNTHNEYAFLGFSDIYQEGHFVTIFGEPLNQTGYTRWSSPNQPDNAGGKENCGSFHRNGGLNDIPCEMKLAYVCEQELW